MDRSATASGLAYRVVEAADDEQEQAALRAGRPEALERLARRELPRVERLLRRMLGPRDDMEDLVQTVFLETCRALPGFRGQSHVSTFVGGITVRVAKRAMRPTAWRSRRGPMPEQLTARGDPEHDAETGEGLERMHGILERIAPKKRIAFTLWALEGMSPRDIAQMTGASVPAVRSRIFYAQKELRAAAGRDPYLRELVEEDADDAG